MTYFHITLSITVTSFAPTVQGTLSSLDTRLDIVSVLESCWSGG